MDIVCCIDNNYVKYCIVTLVSIFENNRNEKINIHLVGVDISEEGSRLIKDTVVERYKQNLSIYAVDKDKLLKDFEGFDYKHISIISCLRLFLPEILPNTLSKALFLDCDLIVRKPIKDLWDINISQYAIGAVEDMWSDKQSYYDRLQYDRKYSYFNGGVLLVNLDYWRENNIQNRLLEYVKNNPEKLVIIDQDMLNAVLHDQKTFIPLKWNVQDGFFRVHRYIRKEVWAELDQIIKDPAIVHYTGGKKPWHYKSENLYKNEYYYYLDKTIWKGERPKKDYTSILLRKLRPIAVFLKLEKAKYRKVEKIKD